MGPKSRGNFYTGQDICMGLKGSPHRLLISSTGRLGSFINGEARRYFDGVIKINSTKEGRCPCSPVDVPQGHVWSIPAKNA